MQIENVLLQRARSKKRVTKLRKFVKQWDVQVMIIPALMIIFVFSYLPMWGVLSAFQDYDIFKGFFGSSWVGLKHFRAFVTYPDFGLIMRNTVMISLLKFTFGFPAPILLALMLNEIRQAKFKRTVQTITYLPHFISWVVVGNFIASMFAVDNGSINTLLMLFGIIKEPVNWLSVPHNFWPIIVFSNIWKSTGFGAIYYLAAIAGVNPELYEAASIDGASRLKQIYLITLPCIVPVIITLLILNVSTILNAGFEDIYQLTNALNNTMLMQYADSIDVYSYRVGLRGFMYSYGTAIGLFKSIINIMMLFLANSIARRLSETSLF